MNLKQIKEIAKSKGVKVGIMKKTDLIRTIQRTEGFSACFSTVTDRMCNQIDCLWRSDCLK